MFWESLKKNTPLVPSLQLVTMHAEVFRVEFNTASTAVDALAIITTNLFTQET
jgi:hypothetical protein